MQNVPIVIDDQAQNEPNSGDENQSGDGDEDGEEEQEQQFDDDSQENDEEDGSLMQAKKVRDTLATIFIPFEGENKPMVFSYHYQYEQYLKDNNLIDVSFYLVLVSFSKSLIYYSLRKPRPCLKKIEESS